MSDDEILDEIRYQMQRDQRYRDELQAAVKAKNESWIRRLIRKAVGIAVEVGRAILAAIIGWALS